MFVVPNGPILAVVHLTHPVLTRVVNSTDADPFLMGNQGTEGQGGHSKVLQVRSASDRPCTLWANTSLLHNLS